MHLCMQDDQNGQKTMVLTSAEETRLTCFILLQNIFFWSNQPNLTANVNTIINLPWYPRKIVHFSLVLSPSRVYYNFYDTSPCSISFDNGHSSLSIAQSGNTNWSGRLSTVDLLVKVTCFSNNGSLHFQIKNQSTQDPNTVLVFYPNNELKKFVNSFLNTNLT